MTEQIIPCSWSKSITLRASIINIIRNILSLLHNIKLILLKHLKMCTLVYTFPMCMAWRFHFPIRKYDCYVEHAAPMNDVLTESVHVIDLEWHAALFVNAPYFLQ